MRDLRHFHDKLPPYSELVKSTNPLFLITLEGINQASTPQDKLKAFQIGQQFLKADKQFMLIFVRQGKYRSDWFEILPDQYDAFIALLSNNNTDV